MCVCIVVFFKMWFVVVWIFGMLGNFLVLVLLNKFGSFVEGSIVDVVFFFVCSVGCGIFGFVLDVYFFYCIM